MDFSLSLCLVNTLWQKYKKTYVDNFVPLMATTLRKHSHDKIDLKELKPVADHFFEDYGIRLPQGPILAILDKCKKNNIVRRLSGTYFLNTAKALEYDISKEAELNIQRQKILFSDFANFVNAKHENFKGTITHELASNLLLSFIESNDVGLFFLSGEATNGMLPEPKLPHDQKKYKYIFSEYITYLYQEKPDTFRIIVDMVLGGIATNALLFSFSNKTSESVKDCNIYLDTALILRLVVNHY
jgi:hypothetical protein